MKKRFLVLWMMVLFSIAAVLPGCGGGKQGGEGSKLFSFIPEDAVGVLTVNFKSLAQLELFDKAIEEAKKQKTDKPGETFKDYQDFVTKTGIDPKKDINGLVIAFHGKLGSDEISLAIDLNYKRDSILALAKKNAPGFTEDTYNGVGVYKFKDDKGKEMAFSFLSDNIIAAGCPVCLQKMIDLSKGKGRGIMANAQLAPYLKKVNTGAIFSFAFGLPADAKKVHDLQMFKFDLSKAEAIYGYFDYSGKTWKSEIILVSNNEAGNQQLATTLNGLKPMAAAFGPEVAELANNINFTAAADSVKFTLTITDELIEKLTNKVKSQMTQLAPAPAETPATPPGQ